MCFISLAAQAKRPCRNLLRPSVLAEFMRRRFDLRVQRDIPGVLPGIFSTVPEVVI
jgi:hypothetical protein